MSWKLGKSTCYNSASRPRDSSGYSGISASRSTPVSELARHFEGGLELRPATTKMVRIVVRMRVLLDIESPLSRSALTH